MLAVQPGDRRPADHAESARFEVHCGVHGGVHCGKPRGWQQDERTAWQKDPLHGEVVVTAVACGHSPDQTLWVHVELWCHWEYSHPQYHQPAGSGAAVTAQLEIDRSAGPDEKHPRGMPRKDSSEIGKLVVFFPMRGDAAQRLAEQKDVGASDLQSCCSVYGENRRKQNTKCR